ncbi:MAG TPA: type II toxin-antitoxin system HigB family toxin [Afipia sp.]
MSTNVIAKKALQSFWTRYPQAEVPLSTWYQIVSKGTWTGPADIKAAFGANVDFVGDNRVIFDIGGNKYRLIVHFAYPFKTALIKFVGTHDEYDGISPETV